MAVHKIPGPDGDANGLLGMDEVRKLLGGVSEEIVRQMIASSDFPNAIQAGPRSPPQWSAPVIACWLHIRPMMTPRPESPPKGGKGPPDKGD
jgi:hypothetical protein